MYSSYSPYAYVGNDPILFHDPNGMYRVDANGNITIDDPDEISSFFNYLNNNSGASINDMSNHIISADNGFSWELDAVSVTGRNSFESGGWLSDAQGRVSDAVGLMGNINSISTAGSHTALSILDLAGKINDLSSGALEGATYKHYLGSIRPSAAYGFNVYAKPVLNMTKASPFIRGSGYLGVAISTATVATTWATEGHFGHKTKVATAKALTGWAGAWAGAKIGMTAGGVFGAPAMGIGAVPGALIGGIVGAAVGGWGGSAIAEAVYR